MANIKKYFTEEEKKNAHREAMKKWYQKNIERQREKSKEHQKIYYETHKEIINEKAKIEYRENQLRRAYVLLHEYNRADELNNRGKGDLTEQWIVDNIFTKSCKCGETDWRKLGCNRLDNSKPHTMDNVEPCCKNCNSKHNAGQSNRDEFGKFKKGC
ncbi:MAG: hypothetical protein IKE95_09630 [Methanobrevibacter sp.]|nr:hypothetical protein [Methanobrevibacter sp.]